MSGSILFMESGVGTLPQLIRKTVWTSNRSALSDEECQYLIKVAEILERSKIETKTQLMKRIRG